MNWKECTLGDLITFQRGHDLPKASMVPGEYPVVGSNGIIGWHNAYTTEEPSITIGRSGNVGNPFIWRGKSWSHNTTLYIKAFRHCDPEFIYYYLKTMDLGNYAGGSAVPTLNRNHIHTLPVVVPESIDDQKRIASVLRSIEDKIACNDKINDNLQQQAMALYAEMFLNSSDNNVTSGTLSDIAAITMGQSPSGSSYNEDGVGEVFYQGRAEFGFRFPKRRLFTTEPKRMAETGDVLLSVRAPVGDLNVAYERCCIGRGLGAIHSKTGHSSFVLYTMFALRSQLDVFNGEGTVFGSINRDALNAIPIDIPPVTEIDQFEAVAHPIDELIRANYEENCRLEAIRDSLLPKLMSGEIDVSAVNL